jgi:bifunctional ADP-heptose synthase (sugar kinase/adenylyltransferase)
MDTRDKILTLEGALSLQPARPLTIVTGLFDVLRASHVRELEDVRNRTSAAVLMAVVLPFPEALLSHAARTEMAAALRVLDYVVSADVSDLDRLTAALQPAAIVRLEDHDAARVRELIAHVHSRQTRP